MSDETKPGAEILTEDEREAIAFVLHVWEAEWEAGDFFKTLEALLERAGGFQSIGQRNANDDR